MKREEKCLQIYTKIFNFFNNEFVYLLFIYIKNNIKD